MRVKPGKFNQFYLGDHSSQISQISNHSFAARLAMQAFAGMTSQAHRV
jgi:hypothetical protein